MIRLFNFVFERFKCVAPKAIEPTPQLSKALRVDEVDAARSFGSRDQSVPAHQVKTLADAVNQAGGSFTTHTYYADHAFFNDSRPTVYDKDSSELAWKRTLGFLKENMK